MRTRQLQTLIHVRSKKYISPPRWYSSLNMMEKVHTYDDETKKVQKYYIQTFGCQMNVADTEVVSAIMNNSKYTPVNSLNDADIVLINTCAIREKAENRAIQHLRDLQNQRKSNSTIIGVLGCLAEHLKSKITNELKLADIVIGPDNYRNLPTALESVKNDKKEIVDVAFNHSETYENIEPLNSSESVKRRQAFVSIMRGCNNMCTFCVVPHTRGKERSRDINSIVKEVKNLSNRGYKEVVLLGQNVNSYFDKDTNISTADTYIDKDIVAEGFENLNKSKHRYGFGYRFHDLLEQVASIDKNMRIRFTSPHPKDFNDKVIEVIKKYPNIVKGIHLPVQSGSDRMLDKMRRNHTIEAYHKLIEKFKQSIPSIQFSTDIIAGFCYETEDDHKKTIDVLKSVQYTQAFIFAYSSRKRTKAFNVFQDTVSQNEKKRRLNELNHIFHYQKSILAQQLLHTFQLVLVEGQWQKDEKYLFGMNDGLRRIIFEAKPLVCSLDGALKLPQIGDYVKVKVIDVSKSTLIGYPMNITNIELFYNSS